LNLNNTSPPHIRHSDSTRVLMLNVIFPMLIIYVSATFYYQTRALMLLLVSVTVAVLTDTICVLIAGKRPNLRDFSPVVTGTMLPLLMPASIDYWILGVAAAFAVVIAKHPFGGVGHNVFNPAAAGLAFVTICFGDKMFSYPIPRAPLPVFGSSDLITVVSPAFMLELGAAPKYDLIEILTGNFPGPMGCTNILVILGCLLYLVSRRTVRWVMPVSFFVTVALFAFLFPRIGGGFEVVEDVRLRSVLFEMAAGVLLFGGVFMLGDPVTTPKRDFSKAVFAVAAGIIVMLFRRYGSFESAFPFALLLMNATVWGFDMTGEMIAGFFRRMSFENTGGKKLQKKTSRH